MLRYTISREIGEGEDHLGFLDLKKQEQDAGYDLASTKRYVVPAHGMALVSTALKLAIPKGYYGQIFPRSSLSLQGIDTTGGVIDSSYRGEIKVILKNNTDEDFLVSAFDRVAQIVIIKIFEGGVVKVESLDSTQRGANGFGSTGKSSKSTKQKYS